MEVLQNPYLLTAALVAVLATIAGQKVESGIKKGAKKVGRLAKKVIGK